MFSLSTSPILCDCPTLGNHETLMITNLKTADVPTATVLRYVTCKIATMIIYLLIMQLLV